MAGSLPSEREFNMLWRHFGHGYAPLNERYEVGRRGGGPAIATKDGAGRRVELVLTRPIHGVSRGQVAVDGQIVASDIASADEITDSVVRATVSAMVQQLRSEAQRLTHERDQGRGRPAP